jgi:hypothetical protein
LFTSSLLLVGLKMAFSAIMVVLTSLIAERARPFIAAMVATLPISAGPALLFLALDHDDIFMNTAMTGTLATNTANAFYCLAYAALAQKHGLALSLLPAFLVWALVNVVLRYLDWSLAPAMLVNMLAYGAAIWLARPFLSNTLTIAPPRPWYALPARALAVALLVAAVTTLSWMLGPYYSGILATIPIVMTSLIVILHPRIGGVQTGAMIANALPGLLGFAYAAGGTILMIPIVGRYWALAAGLGMTLLWNGMLVILKQRRETGWNGRSG